MKESFNFIEFSNEKLFNRTSEGRIELKKYYDELIFYSSFDSTFDAIYYNGDNTAEITGTATNEINAVFGQSLLLSNGTIKYNRNNFDNLLSEGNVKFRIKPDYLTGRGYQYFNLSSDPLITTIPDIDTTESKFGGGSLYLLGTEQKYISYSVDNVSTLVQEGTIELDIKFNSIPTTSNYMLFMIGNVGNNNNLIKATYNTDGKIYFTVYDQSGNLLVDINFDWNDDGDWHNYSFNFDINNGNSKVFIDGIQYGITSTNIGTRDNTLDIFTIGAGDNTYITNQYVDNFSIYSQKLRDNNYTPPTIALTGDEDYLLVYADYDTSINLDVGDNSSNIIYPTTNNYECKIYVDGTLNSVDIALDTDDTLLDIANKISAVLTNAIAIIDENKIKVLATIDGARISIEEPDTGRSLLSLLDGVSESIFPNAPSEDTSLFELKGDDDKNKIQIIHTIDGKIKTIFYDKDGNEKVNEELFYWNCDNITWYAFEFSWNETIGQFFLDGELQKVFITNFERESNTDLYISSGNTNYYFDELIINNSYGNNKNFTVDAYALTPYPTYNPYIDIHFGDGFKENEVIDLNLIASTNTSYVVKLENDWYYYFSGSWRTSDGSYSQSNSPSELETKFADLYFNENKELVIRVYFHSDGLEESWIDEISIETITSDELPALITGTVKLDNPVDLSSNSHVLITTDAGSLEVDLSSTAVDVSAVTLDEIKSAINSAGVPGLAAAMSDSDNHLVLASSNTGSDALVSISNGITTDALSIVWGYEATDSGEDTTGKYFDYTEITRWVRSRLGGGVVPVELTDEQIEDCVSEAVYWYNYYRNAKENIMTVTLEGDDVNGYKIPLEVGGEENIIEIIMKPRFPLAYYAGGADNIMNNLYMQWFFNSHVGGGYQNIMGDYYITLSTEKDMDNILGTQVKWEFFNGRLFLSPIPTYNLTVGIKFRSAISIGEINTNQLIKEYTLAKAKQVLGTIRSTFGGTIPGGGETITLRGESLISEGKEEEEKALQKMMKLSEPLFLEFF